MLSNKFCPSRLQSEIALCKSDFFFLGVTILSYKITSKACQHIVLDFTLGTLCQTNHFRDLTKMIIHIDILRLA